MNENFSVMIPYRTNKTDKEYSDDIRALVEYMSSKGIRVNNLKESDILDENNNPVERVYLIECFGRSEIMSNIFSHRTIGYYGETVLYA